MWPTLYREGKMCVFKRLPGVGKVAIFRVLVDEARDVTINARYAILKANLNFKARKQRQRRRRKSNEQYVMPIKTRDMEPAESREALNVGRRKSGATPPPFSRRCFLAI